MPTPPDTAGAMLRILDKPATMAAVLAAHYTDRPLSQLPGFAIRAHVAAWQARRDVIYLEARTETDETAGFVFAQSIGERPWRVLLRSPVRLAPLGAALLIGNRLSRMRPARRPGARASGPADDHAADDGFPALPEGLPGPQRYFKIEHIRVLAPQRGRGVAGQLFTALEAAALAHGVHGISSTIQSRNTASIRAHARAGFDIYAETPGMLRTMRRLRTDSDHADQS